MGRATTVGKHKSTKFVLICVALLGAALFADLFWASSSSSSSLSISSNWPIQNSDKFVLLPLHNTTKSKGNKDTVPERFLSATFADLPGPELEWEKMATAPVPRLDGAAIQIKNLLYVFAGYGTIDTVHSHVDIYNFTDNTWGGRFDMPREMAHSHLGMVTDGRYIYVVTGQYGPQCRGPTARTFVLDTETKQWRDMPSLPVPRYAPATQLWKGRLHVMGGSKENRHTPALEHWSLAVKDGKAIEKEWRNEIPIPHGGPHRACIVVNDRLYIIGGQEGDFMAKPGSPIFKCSRRNEVVYADVYMLDNEMKWKALPPMPKPDSHIEFAWAIVNNSIVIVGGTTDKHPETKRMTLVGEVFQFNLDTLKWSVVGKLPYRVKTTLVGFWNGWLYFTSGQRDRGPDDPAPKKHITESKCQVMHLCRLRMLCEYTKIRANTFCWLSCDDYLRAQSDDLVVHRKNWFQYALCGVGLSVS
ncbi:Kelch repeat-containing protein [Camellia lanceoleosa]|uniref:Kelch repeat-containing protein n=1 Tax=Camellia lanceoleosa TaxID=1840588 RepID=A0ACC0F7Z6_9ERIC|nr:Kelch repeat-containing protein [Camellia lanceoleosa]